MKKNNKNRVGSEVQYGPRKLGEILQDYLKNSNEPLAVAYRARLFKDIHPHTELGVDLKLLTREPGRMPVGAMIDGAIAHDGEDHFSFTETLPSTNGKRNPHVFRGKYITITRRDDGTLRLNFRPLRQGPGFNLERYATGVSNEILWALQGYVEEVWVMWWAFQLFQFQLDFWGTVLFQPPFLYYITN